MVFPPCLALPSSGETNTAHRALLPHPLQTVQVWSKWVSNKGHFTLEDETLFPPCLALPSIGETDTAHSALLPRPLKAVEVWSTSVCNKGHFTPEDKTVFPISPPLSAGRLTQHAVQSYRVL
jgi:hypothetical protein